MEWKPDILYERLATKLSAMKYTSGELNGKEGMLQHFNNFEKRRRELGEFQLINSTDPAVLLEVHKHFRASLSAKREKQFMDFMSAAKRLEMLWEYAKLLIKKSWTRVRNY